MRAENFVTVNLPAEFSAASTGYGFDKDSTVTYLGRSYNMSRGNLDWYTDEFRVGTLVISVDRSDGKPFESLSWSMIPSGRDHAPPAYAPGESDAQGSSGGACSDSRSTSPAISLDDMSAADTETAGSGALPAYGDVFINAGSTGGGKEGKKEKH